MQTEKDKALSSAKIGLLTKGSKFIATIAFSMKHVWDEDIPTAGTDGKTVRYNPDFFMSLSPKERIFLLAHEAFHIALLHLTRRGKRDPMIYNFAGDYVINQLLVDAGMSMPDMGLYDIKYKGMTTEEVYDLLIKDPPPAPQGGIGQDLLEGATEEEIQEIEANIVQTLVKAQTRSKMSGEKAGTVPNEVEIIIDELINPKLKWNEILERFLTDKAKDDYSWQRPNRFFQPDFIIPSQYSEALGELTVAIDTSGSLSQKDLIEILSEIQYIHETMKPSKLTIIDCDYKIHHIHEVKSSESITELEFSGRGGTSLHPVIEHCNKTQPQVLIYFTDLHAQQITEETEYPIIWICNSNHEPAPIGETIYLN